MREILFRVYDKEEGRYRQLDGLHDTMMIDRDGKASYYNLQNGSGGDEYIIEQFTGMRDEGGKRIFEGDILEVGMGPRVVIGDDGRAVELESGETRNALYVVEYESSSFTLRGVEGSFEGLGLLPHIMDCRIDDDDPPRVIGNIHENPELVEDPNAR